MANQPQPSGQNRNKDLRDLGVDTGPEEQTGQSQPDSQAGSQPDSRQGWTPPATTPRGADVGGVPQQPLSNERLAGPSGNNTPTEHPNTMPPSQAGGPTPGATDKAGGHAGGGQPSAHQPGAHQPGTSLTPTQPSRPDVDTGGVKAPLDPEAPSGKPDETPDGTPANSPEAQPQPVESGGAPADDSKENGSPETPGAQPARGGQEASSSGSGNSPATQPEKSGKPKLSPALGKEKGGAAAAGGGAVAMAGEAAEKVKEVSLILNPAVWGMVIIALITLFVLIVLAAVIWGLAGTGTGGAPTTSASGTCGEMSGTPKEIIDSQPIPMAQALGIKVTPESVEAANAAHSTYTTSGGVSDHKGPPEQAWAADISNSPDGNPTPEMDQLSKDLAACYGFPPEQWRGGCHSTTRDGYRIQLIYRTQCGGNHNNHVHIGIGKA